LSSSAAAAATAPASATAAFLLRRSASSNNVAAASKSRSLSPRLGRAPSPLGRVPKPPPVNTYVYSAAALVAEPPKGFPRASPKGSGSGSVGSYKDLISAHTAAPSAAYKGGSDHDDPRRAGPPPGTAKSMIAAFTERAERLRVLRHQQLQQRGGGGGGGLSRGSSSTSSTSSAGADVSELGAAPFARGRSLSPRHARPPGAASATHASSQVAKSAGRIMLEQARAPLNSPPLSLSLSLSLLPNHDGTTFCLSPYPAPLEPSALTSVVYA
jgi:hypothetical protein